LYLYFGEQDGYQIVRFTAIMTKIPYLQFVRTLFVLATLVGFGSSSLMACRCAAKKNKIAHSSCCDMAKKELDSQCCKKPVKKPARKACCKMTCCTLSRKQVSIVEKSQSNAAMTAGAGLRSVCVQNFTISNKPLRQAVSTGPCAAELCVFLC
jgi:hypothetical protein